MELYIRIKDGRPFEHPILGDNFRQAFPDIDTNNLPPEFARFIRLEPPSVGLFEIGSCAYGLVNGGYTDIHTTRPMNAEERVARIEQAKAQLPPNWTLNEETLQPIRPPRPTTGGPWRFDHEASAWVISTEPPFPSWIPSEDGLRYVAPTPRPEGQYRWDEATLSWVEIDV